MSEVKNITLTVIFEGPALNRDEKIGQNILSIKKLTFADNVYSYISRQAIRHYLFNTLKKAFPDDWKDTAVRLVRTNNSDTIQFDITREDIISSAELDAFGYMYTQTGNMSITRKATVGITKAVSLLPYSQDISFGANHDLVRRAREQGEDANPIPLHKEENISLFKVSFTIDAEFLGKDSWIADNVEYNKGRLSITIANQRKELQNTEKVSDEEYVCKDNSEKEIGRIKVENVASRRRVVFEVAEGIKKKRIRQILEAVKSGLVAHSSGEDNTIVPLFLIGAPVKVPSPIFHPYIDAKVEGRKIEIVGLKDCVENSWLWEKVYIKNSERLFADISDIKDRLYQSWEEFLNACGLSNGE